MDEVVVSGWIGSANLGDELVFAGLARLLAERGVAVRAVSLDPSATRAAHGIEAVGHRDVPGLWRAVGDSRAVVLGGGGLLQDETSALNLPYHLARPWLGLLRGRSVGGIGLGAGRLDTRLGRALVAGTARRLAVLTVRDAASADLLASLGLDRPEVGADLAFQLPAPDCAPRDRLAVLLRPWRPERGRVPVSMGRAGRETPAWFVPAMARALDRAATATGIQVRFVALDRDRDHALHLAVAERMRTAVSFARPDVSEVLDELAASRAAVTVRYHGAVAALAAGRPFVGVDYAPKLAGLAGDAGDAGRVVPFSPTGVAEVGAAVGEVIGRGEAAAEARERLRERGQVDGRALDRLLDQG